MILTSLFSNSLKDDLFRRLFKNAGILLSGNVGASLLRLGSQALTARALGAESFGILVLISTYVLVIDKLINFQSWQALIKYGAEALAQGRDQDFKALLKFGFLLDIGTAVAGTLIAASGAWFVGRWQGWNPDTVLMATLYSTTILFHIAGASSAILRLFDRFKHFSLIAVATATIQLLGVMLAYLTGAGLWAFVLIWAVMDILGKILLVTLSLRELRQRHYLDLRHASTRKMAARFPGIWNFVITTNLHSSIRMTSREADVLIIGALLNPAAVGLYKIAKQMASILSIVHDPLYQSIYPEFAKLRANEEDRNLIKLAIRSSTFAGTTALFLWGILTLISESLIVFLFGSEFVAAKSVMLWYMMAVVIAVIGFPLQPIMLALGKPQISLWVNIASTVIYYLILLLLLRYLGLDGAGIAYFAYYVMWSLLMLFLTYIFLIREQ